MNDKPMIHSSVKAPHRFLLLGGCLLLMGPLGWAQIGGGFIAPSSALDALSSGPVGPGGAGALALDRARNLPGAPPGPVQPTTPARTTLSPGRGFAVPALPGGAAETLDPVIPKEKVMAGTRVRDHITGELLDDPHEQLVPASEQTNFYDDGTHGDIEAGDGKFSLVDVRDDVLGEGTQRAKEQLVRALVVAENLSPLEFYGFTLMSTELHAPYRPKSSWKLVPDPEGGPGLTLAQVPVERPKDVPDYREWVGRKDDKVKEDWADRFLKSYRINPDSLESEFYPLYIPNPPQPPQVEPPDADQWTPFSDPDAITRLLSGQGADTTGFGGGGASSPFGPRGGVTGVSMNPGTSSNYFGTTAR